MRVSAKADVKELDLAHLAKLLPALKDLKLGGMLDMNLDVHVPYATPADSRLRGKLTTQNLGFRMTSSGLSVEKGNTEIELVGTSAKITTMTIQVNDQKVALSGQISNPLEPKYLPSR